MKSQRSGNILATLVAALLLVGGALALASVSRAAPAATITVTSLNDSGPGTLRQAISNASPGDTIDFG